MTGPRRPFRWLAVGVILASACLLASWPAGPAGAQQSDADVLVAEAILAYDARRYEAALEALGRALALDPNHVDALYYTGLARIALGQRDAAVEALERARALRPDDEAVRYQLGVVYFSLGRYERAQPLLEESFARTPRLESLGYYVGFMRYRNKDYQGSLEAFRAGTTTDPNIEQLTHFYSGLALAIMGLPERAAGEIAEALRLQPASPLTGPAERLRDTVVAAREEERRFRLEVRVGGFYDDNVSVIPRETPDPLVQALRNQRHTSPGWLGSLRGDYSFLRIGGFEGTATYSVFTTQNSDLNQFSLVDHLGGLGASYRGLLETPLGVLPYQATVQYTYDFLTLGGDEFVTRHTVSPSVVLVENRHNATAFQLRYQQKRFARSPNPIQAEKRDGSAYMAGILHIARFAGDRHLLKIGYQADWDFTQGGNLAYFGNRVLAGFQVTFPWAKPFADLRLNYDFDVHLRDYRNFHTLLPVSAANTTARFDAEFTHIVRLTYPLTDNLPFLPPGKIPGTLFLSLDFQAILADSKFDVFSFHRNVGSLSIIWAY